MDARAPGRKALLLLLLSALGGGALLAFAAPGGRPATAEFAWPTVSGATLADGLAEPVHATHAGDGRIFITLRKGSVVILSGGLLLDEPFFTIPVDSGSYEEGLLSLAFPDGYESGDWFYLYRVTPAGALEIGRMRVTGVDPNIANPASYEPMLTIPHPAEYHNGGNLVFGPGGYLYAGTGDGHPADSCGMACPARPGSGTLLGRILRIDPETFDVEVMAAGLRNPWRFTFHDGQLYLADVGDSTWEELNVVPFDGSGTPQYDFGWNFKEGDNCAPLYLGGCNVGGLTDPVFEYSSASGGSGCAIVGGLVYQDIYFMGDFCSGRIWGYVDGMGAQELTRVSGLRVSITSFGSDSAGNLLIVFRGAQNQSTGAVARVVTTYPPGTGPTPVPEPSPVAFFDVPGLAREPED